MFETWFPAHWSTLKKLIWLRMTALGNVIKTVTGAIVTFTCKSAKPIVNLTATLSPIQDLHGYDNPWPAGGGVNKLDVGTQASDYHNTGVINSISGAIVTLNIYGSGGTVTYRNQNLAITGQVNISWAASKTYSRAFVRLRKLDDSGWMTDSDATITGMVYNSYYLGWYVNTATTAMNISIEIPSCLYWNLGIGYGNNEAVAGTTETISNIMLATGSSAPSAYSPYANLCPISGHTGVTATRTGRNLFTYDRTYYDGYWLNGQATGTFAETTLENAGAWKCCKIPVEAGDKITCSGMQATGGVYNAWIGEGGFDDVIGTFGSGNINATFTVPTGAKFLCIVFYNIKANYTSYPNAQVELGETASPYEPYTGNTYPITFPETIYGGTDEVVSGQGTSTMGMVDLGDLNWFYDSGGGNPYFYSMNFNAKPKAYQYLLNNAICSQYEQTGYDVVNGNNGKFGISADGTYLKVCDTRYIDKTAFKTAMSGVQLVYELATPVPFTTTPTPITTLKGQNNVWVDDSDEISVTYYE